MIEALRSECPICDEREYWTGHTEIREDGKTWFEMKCVSCGSVGFEWSREWQDIADADAKNT